MASRSIRFHILSTAAGEIHTVGAKGPADFLILPPSCRCRPHQYLQFYGRQCKSRSAERVKRSPICTSAQCNFNAQTLPGDEILVVRIYKTENAFLGRGKHVPRENSTHSGRFRTKVRRPTFETVSEHTHI